MKRLWPQHVSSARDDIKDMKQYADATDEQLARLSQEHDREAFLTLYNRYLNKVYNRVKSRVPPDDVDDVTQEVFVAVVRSIGSFKLQSKFNTWLYTIVNRQIADFYRRRTRKGNDDKQTVSLDAMDFGEPSYQHEQLDEQAAIYRAMNTIPEHYREIVLLRFADGMSFAEIAESRGQSLEAVKSLYRRAIQAIKDEVGEVQ